MRETVSFIYELMLRKNLLQKLSCLGFIRRHFGVLNTKYLCRRQSTEGYILFLVLKKRKLQFKKIMHS